MRPPRMSVGRARDGHWMSTGRALPPASDTARRNVCTPLLAASWRIASSTLSCGEPTTSAPRCPPRRAGARGGGNLQDPAYPARCIGAFFKQRAGTGHHAESRDATGREWLKRRFILPATPPAASFADMFATVFFFFGTLFTNASKAFNAFISLCFVLDIFSSVME